MPNSSIWSLHGTVSGCYHSRPECTWERWEWRGTLHSPKLQYYWSLTIRLISVVSRTLVRESYSPTEMQSLYSAVPTDWATGHTLGSLTSLQRGSRCIMQSLSTGPQDTRRGSLTLLQRGSWRILQPQPTGQGYKVDEPYYSLKSCAHLILPE